MNEIHDKQTYFAMEFKKKSMERNNLMDLLFVFATITVDQKYISNTRVCNIIFLYIASTLSN